MKRLLLFSFSLFALYGCKQNDPKPKPIADFSYTVSLTSPTEQVISLVDKSKYADRVEWSTNTGAYGSGGTYYLNVTRNGRIVVTLTAKNNEGQDTKTDNIDITSIATTGSTVFWSQIGNRGDISIYVNGTYQGKLTKYKNNGQAATCGQEGFVTITLPTGTYPFTAQTNELFPLKWNGAFSVKNGSCLSQELTK